MNPAALIVVALVLGLIPAFIAQRKRQGFWTYYVFGVLLWIIAMPTVLLMKDRRARCPACREVVRSDASVCAHCRSSLPGQVRAA